jgi:hypothetical protein
MWDEMNTDVFFDVSIRSFALNVLNLGTEKDGKFVVFFEVKGTFFYF